LNNNKILNPAQREASLTAPRLADGSVGPYALGWFVGSQNGRRTVLHGGAWQGFKSIMNRYIDDRLTVIVLANSRNARQSKIANMVAAHYEPRLATVRAKAIPDTEPATMARAREAIRQLAQNTMPAGLSDSEKKRYTSSWIRAVADEINNAGPLRSVELLSRTGEGDSKRSRYRFTFDEETMVVTLAVGTSGSINSLGISLE
jgi:hypothetical protein